MGRFIVCFLFLYFLIFRFCANSNAQESKGVNYKDTAAINELIKIAAKQTNLDSAIKLFEILLKESIDANYPNGAAAALGYIGLKYVDKGDYAKAFDHFKRSYPYSLKSTNKEEIALYYNGMAVIYFHQGDYVRASQNYYIALNELKKNYTKLPRTAALIYSNLAAIDLTLGQNEEAKTFLKEAVSIARDQKSDYIALEAVINNLAGYYVRTYNTDSARICLFETLDISNKNNDLNGQIYANENLGNTYIISKQYDKAVSYLQTAVALAKNKDIHGYISSSYYLGEAYYYLGKYHEAETILVSALKKADTFHVNDEKISGYQNLAAVYDGMGEYKKEVECMGKMMILNDSLMGIEKTKAIDQLDIKFKTAEKDKQIALQNVKIARKNMWMVIIISGLFLLAIISITIYRSDKHKQRIQAEEIKILQKENTIGTLKGIVQGEENERSRIAKELHDGIGGILSAAMMHFRTIRHDKEEITKIPAYNEAMGLLNEMGDEIRKTAHNLMPEVLLNQTLPEAIRSYCNSIRESGSLQIDFQSYGWYNNISHEVKLNIYRIVQELLKNITQHADASHVLVQLLKDEQLLTITVEDNGVGFNTKEVKYGMGLHNLQTRVKSLNGYYTLESEIGKGTFVFIEFYLQDVKDSEKV